MYNITYVMDRKTGYITNAGSLPRAIYKHDDRYVCIGELQAPQNNFEAYYEKETNEWIVGRTLYGKWVEYSRYDKL